MDERERLIAEYIHEHPAETRAAAANAVYSRNSGLYEKCRREETVDRHGQRLEIYGRAKASFGVSSNQYAKSTDADVTTRVAEVAAKSDNATMAQAADSVFRGDEDAYQRWRSDSFR